MRNFLKSLIGLPSGFTVGFLSAFIHQAKFNFGVTIYWGFIFVLIFLGVSIRMVNNFANTKLAAVFFISGWFLATLLLAMVSRGGDIVLANDLITKGYLVLAVITLGVVAVWPVRD